MPRAKPAAPPDPPVVLVFPIVYHRVLQLGVSAEPEDLEAVLFACASRES